MTKEQLEQFLKIQDDMSWKSDIIFEKMIQRGRYCITFDHAEYNKKNVLIVFDDGDSTGCVKSFPIDLMLLDNLSLSKKLDETLEKERQEIERKRLLKEEEERLRRIENEKSKEAAERSLLESLAKKYDFNLIPTATASTKD